jgi:TolB protein
MLRFFLSLMIALLALGPARAEVRVDVTQGHLDPLPIAVTDFGGGVGDMAGVVRANLERSGLFRPIDPAAHVERGLSPGVSPRFQDWRVINTEALIVGAASRDAEGRLRVDFRVWDVLAERELLGLQFTSTPENWRRIAHKVSDAVYERLTGEPGYFDTRIVFVAESGTKVNRIKRLAVMDQDGANPSFLTSGADLIMNPRFSPSAQQIVYSSLEQTGLRVYLFNIDTGRREAIAGLPGMTFAPRFSPDGASVALSLDADGNSEVYVKNLRSGAVRRLTNHPAIDTSPSFSPDGAQIVFNSDRGGSAQLYVMGADGASPRRISFGPGRYSTPVWSPRGDLIAFTRQTGGRFQIGVIRPDGSGERILSESYFEEGPTWAPNGRVLMFHRDTPGGESSMWAVDVSGRNLRRIATPGAASDPAWSPSLP